jgi:hypothetical protein
MDALLMSAPFWVALSGCPGPFWGVVPVFLGCCPGLFWGVVLVLSGVLSWYFLGGCPGPF